MLQITRTPFAVLVCQEDFTSDQADSYDVAVGDVNGDGWLDVVVANEAVNHLYMNRRGAGGSVFAKVTTGAFATDVSAGSRGVALADFDGDGDMVRMLCLHSASRLTMARCHGSGCVCFNGRWPLK